MDDYYLLDYCIYLITTPHNKTYVGTTNNFERRKQQHLSNINTGENKLYRHLRQFKNTDIQFTIIKSNLSPKQAHALERVYIKKYTQFQLLNERQGGEGITGIYTECEQEHRDYIKKQHETLK